MAPGWEEQYWGWARRSLAWWPLFLVGSTWPSVSVSLFTDRIGKRRSVIFGIVGSLIGYVVMPDFNVELGLAVAAIGVTRMFFEFSIVSYFPLLSEQAPAQRGPR